MNRSKRSHAVVIGGSVAGLCAARSLGAHFGRITLIERDALPTGQAHRSGVPQSHHVHALLLRGLLELEHLFPGIEAELTEQGASRMDLGSDFAHCSEWGWARPHRIDVAPLTTSRLLIESVIRERVRSEMKNVTLLEGTRITGLTVEHAGNRVRVSGVTTSRAELPRLEADLVIDASGRNSKCLDWLDTHGIQRPQEILVDALAGYASRFYQLAPDPSRWWRGMLIDAKPPDFGRWALLMPVEGGRSVLTLGGLNRDYPPGDEAGFEAFLGSLLSPVLAREIERAKPVSEIHTHRALFNRARRYDCWRRDVGGFVALGDSAVAFNPAHGQGISMAAAAANALGETLARLPQADPYAVSRSFHRAQWKRLIAAWNFATGIDLQWPNTEGKRPLRHRLLHDIGVSIARSAHEEPDLKTVLGPVFQLVAEPHTVLLRPRLLARLFWGSLRRGLGLSLVPAEASDFGRLPAGTTRG